MKKINDEMLMLFLENGLSPEDKQQVENALKNSVELQEKLTHLQASQLPYKEAFNAIKQPPLPQDTSDWVNNLCNTHQKSSSKTGMMYASGFAVFLFIGIFLGYGYALNSERQSPLDWVTPIAQYQSLYVKETIEPLAFNDKLTNDVLALVDKRYGLKLTIPDLSQAGKEFKRIQFLEMDGQPVLQLVYKDEQGLPLALCMVINRSAFKESIAPQIVQHKNINSLSWQSNHAGITLLGKQPAANLQKIEQQLSNTESWFKWQG